MKIGIDIGNSYVAAASVKDDRSFLFFKDASSEKNYNTFTPIKIYTDDKFAYVGRMIEQLQETKYEIEYAANVLEFLGSGNKIYKESNQLEWSAKNLLALTLKKVKIDIESMIMESMEGVVCTTPSYFTKTQLEALKKVFKISGFNLINLIASYKAALVEYELYPFEKPGHYITIDIGKTQSNFTIVHGDSEQVEVVYQSQKLNIGGEMFDKALLSLITAQIENKVEDTIYEKSFLLQKKLQLIKAKLSTPFSSVTQEFIEIEDKLVEIIINKYSFQEIISPIIKQLTDEIQKVLIDVSISSSSIEKVLITGGSGKMVFLQEELGAFFGSKEKIVCKDPRRVQVKGAALIASNVNNYEELLKVETPILVSKVLDYEVVLKKKDNSPLHVCKWSGVKPPLQSVIEVAHEEVMEFVVFKNKVAQSEEELLGNLSIKYLEEFEEDEKTLLTIRYDKDEQFHFEAKCKNLDNIGIATYKPVETKKYEEEKRMEILPVKKRMKILTKGNSKSAKMKIRSSSNKQVKVKVKNRKDANKIKINKNSEAKILSGPKVSLDWENHLSQMIINNIKG